MAQDHFSRWRQRGVAKGQRHLADTIRRLVYLTEPQMFERLDFGDDHQFLDPLLFAFFTHPAPMLDLSQVLYGLLRDSETGAVRTTLEVGALSSAAPDPCVLADVQIPFKHTMPLHIRHTRIDLACSLHPLLYRFFANTIELRDAVSTAQSARSHRQHLLPALSLLQGHSPSVYNEIAKLVRLIVLFSAPDQNSFATLSAHGAIFCNVRDSDNEIALVEDVVHQAAHVSFNALAYNPALVIAIDPETPMDTLCAEQGEVRSIYAAFHGLFTYTLICQALAEIHAKANLSRHRSHEALGRLCFTLDKYGTDIERLDRPEAYTAVGRRCYDAFADTYHQLRARYASTLDGLDFDNQPYTFNYHRFIERNGEPGRHAVEHAL